MLSQLQQLCREAEGRYATDLELRFMDDYLYSYSLRFQTYQKLREVESRIVQQVYQRMKEKDPNAFYWGNQDVSAKWKQDTLRVLRYSAAALLVNDPDTLRERFLLWFQTIMKAFGTQHTCRITYKTMQEVVKQYLSPSQVALLQPILEINEQLLGQA